MGFFNWTAAWAMTAPEGSVMTPAIVPPLMDCEYKGRQVTAAIPKNWNTRGNCKVGSPEDECKRTKSGVDSAQMNLRTDRLCCGGRARGSGDDEVIGGEFPFV